MDQLLEKGACYKAEDGAIMYRSASTPPSTAPPTRRRATTAWREDKDEVRSVPTASPPTLPPTLPHYNKLAERGFDKAIDVWGADHHGHVARMKGAMDAIGLDGSRLDVVLMQMVNLMQNGQPVRMSSAPATPLP